MKRLFRTIISALIVSSMLCGSSATAFAMEEQNNETTVEETMVEEIYEVDTSTLLSNTTDEDAQVSIDGAENTVVTLSRPTISYVGFVQRPTVTVVDNDGNQLEYKKDFKVDYSDWNSTDVGTYTVTVIYMGDYFGSVDYEYEIVPQENVTPVLSRTVIPETGTVQRPLVTVTDKYGNQLEYKKDFTVSYSNWNSTKAGTYTVTANMIGNFSGSQTFEYYIVSGTATLSRTKISYTGTVQRPLVTAKDSKGNQLEYKKDFTVSYSNWNSTNVGTYTVTINYIGKYSGKATYNYYIVPQTDVTPTLSRTVITETGSVQRPLVTVKDKYGNQLTYKKDFTVDYSNWNSTKPGAYKVYVKMNGNYSGTKTYTYYIDAKNCLPLNRTATHISYQYANVQKYVYGTSYQGRNLEAFIITPSNGKYTKTFFMTFSIHGFEDWYANDGKVLTEEANKLVEYYAKNPDKLKNFRLVIVPSVNPDGAIAGYNNNRASYNAFGRCTATHVDMNRDFVSFNAVESIALKNLLSKYKPDVFTDFHGWLDNVYGTSSLCNIYARDMSLSKNTSGDYYYTYLYAYVRNTYNCPSALLEYKSPYKVSHSQTYNSINDIINYYS